MCVERERENNVFLHLLQRVEYPKQAGSLLDTRYVRLEIHYNNPALLEGVRDRSGIRMWLTPHLRPHDMAIIETGTIYSPLMAVPPAQKSFVWNGHCPSSCTKVVSLFCFLYLALII